MNAAADYEAAKALLSRPLPAYVSYTVHSHIKFDAIIRDKKSDVVVRTSDGTVVKGETPGAPPGGVKIGTQGEGGTEPVAHAAFKASCYEPISAHMQTFEGRNLEAIALRSLCAKDKDDKDFETLYVDSATHEPAAAVGSDNAENVSVRLEQGFGRFGDHVMPDSLYVRVHGSGLMFWLDLLVDQRFDDYRFTNTEP